MVFFQKLMIFIGYYKMSSFYSVPPFSKDSFSPSLQHSPHHLNTLNHIESLLLQMKELEGQLLEERQKMSQILPHQVSSQLENELNDMKISFVHQKDNFYTHPLFIETDKSCSLKEISVRFPLEKGEKAYLRLPVQWVLLEKKERDIPYHPTRNISIPVKVEHSCYIIPDIHEKVQESFFYITNKRIILFHKSRLKININFSQVLMRLFYQNALELEYHSGQDIYRTVFLIAKEDISFTEALLASF
jgi:hypothetical protein